MSWKKGTMLFPQGPFCHPRLDIRHQTRWQGTRIEVENHHAAISRGAGHLEGYPNGVAVEPHFETHAVKTLKQ